MCSAGNASSRGFLAREDLVLAGTDLLSEIYQTRGGVDTLELLHHDGDAIKNGDIIANVAGSARRSSNANACRSISFSVSQVLPLSPDSLPSR